MAGGRPTDYRPEYCELLVDHMRQGLSFESFAGVVRTCKQTIYNWLDAHPEFLDAKREGDSLCLLFWEKIGIGGTTGNLKTMSSEVHKPDGTVIKRHKPAFFDSRAWSFNMKNRFKWKDSVDHTSSDGSMKPQVIFNMPKNGREAE